MDRISGLPNELLLKILTFVPTKVAASTCILSKRWEFLWLWLPKLHYICGDVYGPGKSRESDLLEEFINKNLPLHRAPVLDSLRLELNYVTNPEDIKLWVEIAVSRYVRELDISSSLGKNIYPTSLYTCKSLVSLRLCGETRIDVPSSVWLPSLKTLRLEGVLYVDEESLQQLLSVCPVLENLLVTFSPDPNIRKFTIIVPSLQKLELYIPYNWTLHGCEIVTPSLKYLKFEDWSEPSDWVPNPLIEDMPKLREAYVEVNYNSLERILRSVTSVERLTICSEDYEYGDGIVFNKLEHLTLCVCQKDSSTLLCQLLKDSPNLRVLDISVVGDHGLDYRNRMVHWNQPSDIPECLLSSLQIVNWPQYFGRPQDREIAVYILKNARHLKTAIVKADPVEHDVPNLKMITELALSSRASSTCELVFVAGEEDIS